MLIPTDIVLHMAWHVVTACWFDSLASENAVKECV